MRYGSCIAHGVRMPGIGPLPLLRHVRGGVEAIARMADVSQRMAKYYRSGRQRPGAEAVERLLPFLRLKAHRTLRLRTNSPMAGEAEENEAEREYGPGEGRLNALFTEQHDARRPERHRKAAP
jgi:hypothetical protein